MDPTNLYNFIELDEKISEDNLPNYFEATNVNLLDNRFLANNKYRINADKCCTYCCSKFILAYVNEAYICERCANLLYNICYVDLCPKCGEEKKLDNLVANGSIKYCYKCNHSFNAFLRFTYKKNQ